MPSYHKFQLIFYTIRGLSLRQIGYFAFYRLFGYVKKNRPNQVPLTSDTFQCSLYNDEKKIINYDDKSITFLNLSLKANFDNFDWQPEGVSRLWRYNLHYFKFLRQVTLTPEFRINLIQSWIDGNPQLSKPGWEPYTTSLRIVNWVSFFSQNIVPQHFKLSLFHQARWLYSNLEHHIRANHYFENIKAMMFVSSYFSTESGPLSKEVRIWRDFASKELVAQLKEQFLSDGGHYERSPQYHMIMMQNCLELLSLFDSEKQMCSELICHLEMVINKGLKLTNNILRPDKLVPLFNDTSLDETPDFQKILEFAAVLGNEVDVAEVEGTVEMPEFGIYGVKNQTDWIMIDCGDVGPKYQPGHSHCDLLSYELMFNNRMIVVDSGVYEYENTPIRRYLRSTEAHNTIRVNGLNQSEVWSSFRVARRALKINASLSQQKREHSESCLLGFQGAYKGFYHRNNTVVHTRSMNILINNGKFKEVSVTDFIEAREECSKIESFIHIHPDLTIVQQSEDQFILRHGNVGVAQVSLDGLNDSKTEVTIKDGIYSPRFSVKEANKVIVIKSECKCITYVIKNCISD